MTEQTKFQKPFLKWVGGKTQIINTIMDKFPDEMNNYHEIFLGGGSVLFALLSQIKEGKKIVKNKIYAYDVNDKLISVYVDVKENKDELYKHLQTYFEKYHNIVGSEINRKPKNEKEALTSKESYYYWVRGKFNEIEQCTEKSAMFIFLNKTCFRGMYREGPNGFNIPYGHYKKTPAMITKDELDIVSDLIANVEFITSSFEDSLENEKIEKGDFVYLDPPYAPEKSKSFVGYVAEGFTLDSHNQLFDKIKKLDTDKENVKFVLSNSKVELVENAFQKYKCDGVVARRAINAKNPQSKTTEVIIHN